MNIHEVKGQCVRNSKRSVEADKRQTLVEMLTFIYLV